MSVDVLTALWPHQQRAIDDTLQAVAVGDRRVLLTSPTGGGKTRIMCELIERWTDAGLKTVLYTNRKLLVEQLSADLGAHGIGHGVRASGHEDEREFPVQVSSIQTEHARVHKKQTWHLHGADRVIVDEAHIQKGDVAKKILDAHYTDGAAIVGFTATPLDLGGLYQTLLVAGCTSELRACGALVPAHHYGPDEPDLKHIGKVALGDDLTEKQNRKAIMTASIFARVLEWWGKLNPDARPAIGFAPGVAEAVWFCEQFAAAGVRCAAIDGASCWIDGQSYATGWKLRQDILEGSRDGTIKIVWNRFVLREGINMPWLYHGIFATVFGALQSYLQSGGRLLRAHESLDHVIVQDHGGNWHRHGSLNADREWELGQTAAMTAGVREDMFRAKKLAEPARCPQCVAILNGTRCRCGFELAAGKKSRPVIQADGTLKEHRGDIYKQRRLSNAPDADKIWEKVYYRAKKAGMTFRQAEALFAMENKWGYPPRTMPLMPTSERDWFLRVCDVPVERLTQR